MIRLREMRVEDVEYMKEHSASNGIFKKMPERLDYSYALVDDGEPLFVGGISLLNPTVGWCWIDMTELGHKNAIISYRVIRDWMELMVKRHKLRRLMAFVEVGFDAGQRTVEHLGFTEEGTLRNMIDGKPAYLYAKLYDGETK